MPTTIPRLHIVKEWIT